MQMCYFRALGWGVLGRAVPLQPSWTLSVDFTLLKVTRHCGLCLAHAG